MGWVPVLAIFLVCLACQTVNTNGESAADSCLCTVTGDPHVMSFDGRANKFQGACTYILVQDSCYEGMSLGDSSFIVAAKFTRRGQEKHVSWVDSVIVVVDDIRVELKSGGDVTVDGVKATLPAQITDDLRVYDQPNYVYLQTTSGLKIQWDGEFSVRINLDSILSDQICGMCGDCNGDPNNDWMVGPNEEECTAALTGDKSVGDKTENEVEFGYSWLFEAGPEKECIDDCNDPSPPPKCTAKKIEKARKECEVLINSTGALEDCIKAMPKVTVMQTNSDCVYDSCVADFNHTIIVCGDATELVTQCSAKAGVQIKWRSPDLCPLNCPANAHYTTCMKECMPSCDDLKAEKCVPMGTCEEGCQCDDGFVFTNGTCIKASECGCVHEESGFVIPVGAEKMNEKCTEQCVCKAHGKAPECKTMKCPATQKCKLKDEVYQCTCPQGFGLVDGECRGPSTCSCSGDPHCKQFDGGHMNYQGACNYVLAQDGCSNGVPKEDPSFQVVINNDRVNPKKKAAVVKEVTVILGGVSILMQKGGNVLVDGAQVDLPTNVGDEATITDMPNYVTLTTPGGLVVKWDRKYSVRVTVPGSKFDQTCGICGVYNGDKKDDMVMGPAEKCIPASVKSKKGEKIDDEVIVGNSWFHSMDAGDKACEEDCKTLPYPELCESKYADKICAPLKDTNGPLKACLAKLTKDDIDAAYDNCVFDTCTLGEKTDKFACQAGTTLAQQCSEQFNINEEWRTDKFCSMKCPANADFLQCGPTCVPTCADQEGLRCDDLPNVCQEGCFCQEGFVAHKDTCVPVSECLVVRNPCNGQKNPDTGELYDARVQCLTCKNAKSDEDCISSGNMKTCMIPEAVCEYTTVKNGKSDVTKVSRGCASRPECKLGSVGAELCEGSTCTTCNYGTAMENEAEKPVFQCKPYVSREICALKKDWGVGKDASKRYYFNQAKCKCLVLNYKGSGGNENNFETQEACEERCGTWQVPDECLEDKDEGSCDERTKMFYYDSAKTKCKKFFYSGCGGNGNVFKTKGECRDRCKRC